MVSSNADLSDTRILLVENDVDIAASIADYFEARDISLSFAYSVAQALKVAVEEPIDLLILDINLPDGSGIDLCRMFKRERGMVQPVVFLTANEDLEIKLEGFAVGATDYVVKPFALPELFARLQAIWHLSKSLEPSRLLVEAADLRLDVQTGQLTGAAGTVQLHGMGRTIMRELMEAHPRAVPRDRLYDLLWPDEVPQSDPLRANIHQLRQLLSQVTGSTCITSVRGIGYRLDGDG